MAFHTVALFLACAFGAAIAQICIDDSLAPYLTHPGPELVQNGGFEGPYASYPWLSADSESFSRVPAGDDGVGEGCDSFSARIQTFYTRACSLRPSAGIFQQVIVNQNDSNPVFISGWANGVNVSGVADYEFSLYVDVTFQDGTNLFGVYYPFPINVGWTRASITLNETKPVNYLFVSLLFRTHTGTAYFDNISVKKFLEIVYPLNENVLPHPSFESSSCTPDGWTQQGGSICQIQICGNAAVRTGNDSLSLGPKTNPNCFVEMKQLVYFSPPINHTLTFSAYVWINFTSTLHSYINIYADDENDVFTNIKVKPTNGFQLVSVQLTPTHPIGSATLVLNLQGGPAAMTWDDASLVLSD